MVRFPFSASFNVLNDHENTVKSLKTRDVTKARDNSAVCRLTPNPILSLYPLVIQLGPMISRIQLSVSRCF